jgi:hypothetical protein
VAVDDKSFERLFMGEKFLTGPEQIFLCLFVDRNGTPNAAWTNRKSPRQNERF